VRALELRTRRPDEGRWFWLPEVLAAAKSLGLGDAVGEFLLEVLPIVFRYGEQAARDELAAKAPKPPVAVRKTKLPPPMDRGEPLVDLMFARAFGVNVETVRTRPGGER